MKQKREKVLKRFYTLAQLKTSTQRNYEVAIKIYEQATGMNINELYEEALIEEDNNIPRHRRQVKEHFIELLAYMDSKPNLSENTKAQKFNVIKSFYKTMDIPVPNIKNRYNAKPEKVNTQKMLTKPLIVKMIHHAGVRDKAILSTMATTGQAQNEVRHLTIRQILETINHELTDNPVFSVEDLFDRKNEILEYDCFHMDMFRRKTNNYYWTYIAKESIKHIINYLYYRNNGGNKRNLHIDSIDDYLFVTKSGNQMSSTAIGAVCTIVGRKCGFDELNNIDPADRKLLERQEGKHRVWKSHNYRKYFLNMCRKYAGTNPDCNEVWTGAELGDFWIGHIPKSSIKNYIQYNGDDDIVMKQQYLQMLPYLSLEIETKTFTSHERQELNDLKEKYKEMEEELRLLKEYNKARGLLRDWEAMDKP